MLSVAPANPAAGADWKVTVTAGKRWRLYSITSFLSTSAAVATRVAEFLLKSQDVNIIYRVGDQAGGDGQTANSNLRHVLASCWSNVVRQTGGAGGQAYNAYPLPVIELIGGDTIGSFTSSIQAADQWSAIVLQVEEWDV